MAVVLVGEHSTPLGQDMDCAHMPLVEHRFEGIWWQSGKPQTLQEATDLWIDYAVSCTKMGKPVA